jgi:hypothetical protein
MTDPVTLSARDAVLTLDNGKQLAVTLVWQCETDVYYELTDETEEQGLSNGTLYPYVVTVKACFGGLEGLDVLGGVVVNVDSAADDLATVIQEYDMELSAMRELSDQLEHLRKEIAL